MTTTLLPFDPTGVAPTNKVVNEQQVITSVNFRDYHYLVPKLAPFFAESVVIGFKNPDGSSRALTEGVDYYLSHGFISASRACAKPIFGSIEFLSTDLAGVITLTYQSIGGNWTLDEAAIAALLANNLHNPRTTAWEQVANLPSAFPVIDHEWDLVDLVGATEVVESLDSIRAAIEAGGADGLGAHVGNKDNPHDTTAMQVGLGNVQNFPIATVEQAQTGTNTTSYMTPFLVSKALQSLGQSALGAHLQDFNNPHQTTAVQVGLGNVQNYGMADTATATAGTSSTTYMSPITTAAVVAVVNQALTNHINNQQNPHATTKDQLQLFNVQNFPVSTAQQAQTGTDNSSYMTPLRTAQAIALQSSTALASHLADYSNPHQTTKAQVGLGLVDNFATASTADATVNSTANKFMTPQRTYASIMFFVGNDFLNHLNATNPHGTTKSDVGLSLVQNYATASDTDAQAATAGNLYLTPRGASLLLGSSGLTAHLSNRNNPHQVTSAQVGLSNVQNYSVANDSDGTAGTSTTLYATPKTARLAATAVLAPHLINTSNPHQVTANQVGLGLVQNYAIATQTQALAGTDNASYMTPALVAYVLNTAGVSGLNAHLQDFNNPHKVTPLQIGAYTSAETDSRLQQKLGVNQTATNSNALQGSTLNDIATSITQQVNVSFNTFSSSVVTKRVLQSNAADSNNTTGYSWAKLGTLSQIASNQGGLNSYQNAKPDLVWLVSGGENPTAQYGVTSLLRISMRGTNASDPTLYYIADQTPSLASGGVDFGYVWDSTNSVVSVFARMPAANNQMTVTELSQGGAAINISYLGASAPNGVVMMSKNTDLQSQLTQLQADIISGLAAVKNAVANA